MILPAKKGMAGMQRGGFPPRRWFERQTRRGILLPRCRFERQAADEEGEAPPCRFKQADGKERKPYFRRLKGQMVGGWLARRGDPLVLSQGRAQADRSIVGSKGARWQADKKGDFLFLSVRTENGNSGEHSCGQSRSYAESVLNGESTYHN